MTKQEFLAAVGSRLNGLTQEDIKKSLAFYGELIDDHMEEGLREEEAVATLGSVEDVASAILLDMPLPKLVKARMKPSHSLRAWEIVLLVLGFPLWMPLLLTAVILVATVYFLIWTMIFVFYTVVLSLGVSGVAFVVGGFSLLFVQNPFTALLLIGSGFVLTGLAILFFFASNQAVKGCLWLSVRILRGIKSLFIRKGDAV